MQEEHRNTQTCDSPLTNADCEYVFLLRRITSAERTLEIKVDFTPATSGTLSATSGDARCFSVLPTFNHDHKFYTPSFILEEDQVHLILV